ncbi:hypothetical protein chiPu_0019273, partial [Chiloscyllium punctatum]|nr:hypothetical protein [Chiloscyllium punctatum]
VTVTPKETTTTVITETTTTEGFTTPVKPTPTGSTTSSTLEVTTSPKETTTTAVTAESTTTGVTTIVKPTTTMSTTHSTSEVTTIPKETTITTVIAETATTAVPCNGMWSDWINNNTPNDEQKDDKEPLDPIRDTVCQFYGNQITNIQAFKKCSEEIKLSDYIKACQDDHCDANSTETDCSSLEAAAKTCSAERNCVDWRNSTNGLCPHNCTEGFIYKACARYDHDYCKDGEKKSGERFPERIEGCFCENGLMLSEDGTRCVSSCAMRQCKVKRKMISIREGSCSATIEVKACEGYCNSSAIFDPKTNGMKQTCECCQEEKTEEKQISLKCSFGGSRTYTYISAKSCKCKICEGENA